MQQDDISWPQVSAWDATLRIPSFAKKGVIESHGGSTFQTRRTRKLVRDKQGPVKYVADSRRIMFPSDEKAHLPAHVVEAAEFVLRNDPKCLKDFRRKQIGILETKGQQCH